MKHSPSNLVLIPFSITVIFELLTFLKTNLISDIIKMGKSLLNIYVHEDIMPKNISQA